MRRHSLWLCVGLTFGGLGACVAPRDAFERAERSLGRQDLPGALLAFDAVPVSHARYPEARASALSVERRMRRGHELMLQGLLLRGEWRDQEALDVLERACAIWPRMPGVKSLIRATRNRAQLMRERSTAATTGESPILVPELLAGGAPPPAPSVEIAPAPVQAARLDLPSLVAARSIPLLPESGVGLHPNDDYSLHAVSSYEASPPPIPDDESQQTSTLQRGGANLVDPAVPSKQAGAEDLSVGETGRGPSGSAEPGSKPGLTSDDEDEPEPTGRAPASRASGPVVGSRPSPASQQKVMTGGDPIALGLVAVETRLGRGELEAAVADLIELSQRFPTDARVRLRLARVLHQRALQRYGLGQLTSAIVDWERVIVLDPNNAVARRQLATARAEADPGSPRR